MITLWPRQWEEEMSDHQQLGESWEDYEARLKAKYGHRWDEHTDEAQESFDRQDELDDFHNRSDHTKDNR